MNGQNRSSAVMQQRAEPHDSLDDFPTPPWATRAFCEWLQTGPLRLPLNSYSCREPAANRGYMVRPLREYFGSVDASDVHDYGHGFPQQDYLFGLLPDSVDFTITNPPFRLADQFIQRMIPTSVIGCAVIVRSAFLEGIDRYKKLFGLIPPSYVLQHVERVPMVKGRYDPDAASATAYSWLVWMHGHTDTRLGWIAPCRRRLERQGDYPEATHES